MWAPLLLVAAALVLLAVSSARLRGLFVNTAILAAGTLAVALPVGTLLGVVVAKVDVPGRRPLACVLAGMLFVPLYVQAAAWRTVLGSGGWLAERLRGDGYANPWLDGWRGAIWVHAMAAVPWVALAVAAALSTVERKLEEESLMDAAPWRVLWRVSLRRALGGVLAAAAWIAVVAATEISVSDLFQIRTFAEETYTQAALGPLLSWSSGAADLGAGAGAVTMPSFATSFVPSELAIGVAAMVLLVLAALRVMVRWLPPAAAIDADATWKWRPSRGRGAIAGGVAMVAALTVLVPVAGLAWKAGVEVRRVDGDKFERSWSAAKAVAMVAHSPWEHRREWGWSLAVGAMAAASATAIGVMCGWLVRIRSGAAAPLAIAVALGLAIPAPLVGVWIIALVNQPPDSPLAALAVLYDRTLVAPVVAQTVRAAPLAALWMWSQLASVPADLLDAAQSEGAGRFSQLVRIVLPLRRVGMAAGVGAVLVVALGELSATVLVVPPGVTTLPVRVFQLLHYGVDDRVAALCLSLFVLLGGTTAIAAVAARLAARRRHRVPPPAAG